jgi:hypothetical protein
MLPARLPIPLPPARHELITSYVGRLAALHGLGFDQLWAQISTPEQPGGRRRRVLPEALVALTGRPRAQLAGALPELRDPAPDWALFRHEPQPGCPRCDARHPGGPVTRLLPHHRYVCPRHRHWIGPPDIAAAPTPLTELPEIARAQHRHLRLLRRHGWVASYDAVLTGFLICGHLWSQPAASTGDICPHWPRRTDVLIKDRFADFTASRVFAAVYPEAVTLAAVLASPPWRRLAHGDHQQRRQFLAEIGRRLGRCPYQPGDTSDVIAHWMSWDACRPPIRPPRTYLDTRTSGSSPVFTPGRGNQARHERSSYWFARRADGGNVILHHRHVRPVLIRPWYPAMERIEGAIWASADLTTQPQIDLTECAT